MPASVHKDRRGVKEEGGGDMCEIAPPRTRLLWVRGDPYTHRYLCYHRFRTIPWKWGCGGSWMLPATGNGFGRYGVRKTYPRYTRTKPKRYVPIPTKGTVFVGAGTGSDLLTHGIPMPNPRLPVPVQNITQH